MLGKCIMNSCDEVSVRPIVWKTIMSQKNKYLGQYVTVKVELQTAPSISLSTMNSVMPESGIAIRNYFFQKHLSLELGPLLNGSSFSISLHLFLIHVLFFTKFDGLDIRQYTSPNITQIFQDEICVTLSLNHWYTTQSKDIVKSAKKTLLNEERKKIIEQHCAVYDTKLTISRTAVKECYINHGYDGLLSLCRDGINKDIVEYISQLKDDFDE